MYLGYKTYVKSMRKPMLAKTVQSNLSVKPPCPGILNAKSLIPYARFIPEAKKPANGAANDAKKPKATQIMRAIEALKSIMKCQSSSSNICNASRLEHSMSSKGSVFKR